ncbi:MAG: NAD(P)H-binding protein [Candidatus Heimdallarchaeota archaeon]|nr:NAD(P)H-binding protein [Candidatus Heimdallarchaeota archaeon]
MSNICVTGAFSFTGSKISKKLLESKERIRTLTNHADDSVAYFDRVDVYPLCFDRQSLIQSLQNVDVLINTYWIRFEKDEMTFDQAVINSNILFEAAKEAGVKRIIHLSITNPDINSPYPYFRAKARAEQKLMESGLPYSIIRPAQTFGDGDILFNNIAYLMRKLPVFSLIGSGKFGIQPIAVDDLVDICIDQINNEGNVVIDAIGPKVYQFKELIQLINKYTNSRTLIIPMPGPLNWFSPIGIKFLELFLKDVLLTKHEMKAISENLLVSSQEPNGTLLFEQWLENSGKYLGKEYYNQLNRHFK